MTTPYHARYIAHELTRQRPASGVDRLSMALFDANVDLNPHQIEAALFALRSPLSKGVLLADGVGPGKTIEAGLILCQLWAERRRRLLVICPASLRKQWSMELAEKFNLPALVLDAPTYRQLRRDGASEPLAMDAVVITSLNFASTMQAEIAAVGWDLVIIDEAHKLRNAYRPSNRRQRLRARWSIITASFSRSASAWSAGPMTWCWPPRRNWLIRRPRSRR
jgi:SNF2 family DNA or RNA helicase